MKQISVFCGALLLGASFTGHAADKALSLAPTQAGDLIPATLVDAKSLAADVSTRAPGLSRDTVTFSWAIDEDVAVDFAPNPFQAESREFWTTLEAGKLQRGVDILTTAPGAVVRISPVGGARSAPISLDGLQLIRAGRSYSGADAVEDMASAQQLHLNAARFPGGSAAFRINRDVGAGAMTLILPRAAGSALLHVFEPDSSHLLRLAAASDIVLSGSELNISGQFRAEGIARSPSLVQGIVTAPNGATWPMEFRVSGDGFQGSVPLEGMAGQGPGLWEAHVFAALSTAEGQVLRDSRTAFAVSVPTSRLDGNVSQNTESRTGLSFELGVEVSLASRYEIRGVLMGTALDGSQVAVAVGNSAAWLEAGHGTLPLQFDADSMVRHGVGAPYEIRDLRLIRQGDMDLQERRALGFRF